MNMDPAIDMRCSEKRATSPMGSAIYTVVLTSMIPPARLEITTTKREFDAIELGEHRAVDVAGIVGR